MTDDRTTPYATLILRLALGSMLIAHGLLKAVVFTMPGTMQFFESAGFPGWLAYPTVGAELIGGALILIGLYSRWAALAILPVLLGALSVHVPNGWVFSAPNGEWEYPAFLAVAAVVQGLLGDGQFAVADLLARRSGLRPLAHAI